MTGRLHRDLTNSVGEWGMGVITDRESDTPGAAADAAEAARALCHLLVNGGYLPAQTTYALAGDLSALMYRVAEALPNAAAASARAGDVPGVTAHAHNTDDPAQVTAMLEDAHRELRDAAVLATQAGIRLQSAQSALALVYHATTPQEAPGD